MTTLIWAAAWLNIMARCHCSPQMMHLPDFAQHRNLTETQVSCRAIFDDTSGSLVLLLSFVTTLIWSVAWLSIVAHCTCSPQTTHLLNIGQGADLTEIQCHCRAAWDLRSRQLVFLLSLVTTLIWCAAWFNVIAHCHWSRLLCRAAQVPCAITVSLQLSFQVSTASCQARVWACILYPLHAVHLHAILKSLCKCMFYPTCLILNAAGRMACQIAMTVHPSVCRHYTAMAN